jgi:hypothetical protein
MYIVRVVFINNLYLRRKCLSDCYNVHKATHPIHVVLVVNTRNRNREHKVDLNSKKEKLFFFNFLIKDLFKATIQYMVVWLSLLNTIKCTTVSFFVYIKLEYWLRSNRLLVLRLSYCYIFKLLSTLYFVNIEKVLFLCIVNSICMCCKWVVQSYFSYGNWKVLLLLVFNSCYHIQWYLMQFILK